MATAGSNNSPVLYVEDEENDILLVQLAFQRAGATQPLAIASDGREAIEYLTSVGHHAHRRKTPLPRLVLLDLNLPIVSGFEVLQWIRRQPAFRDLPVIVFSSSDRPQDQERARQMGATGYLVKPINMGHMDELIGELIRKWLQVECAAACG